MIDPENGNFRLSTSSPAIGYGCQTFNENVDQKFYNSLSDEKKYFQSIIRDKSSIEVFGSITQNTIWDCDTVRVVDNLVIENGITLTINPGTRVEFQGYFDIDVKGTISSIGNPDNFIHYTISDPSLFVYDSTQVGCWNGISFDNTSSVNDSSKFVYSIFEYSKATSIVDFKAKVKDKDNRFEDATGGVFYLNRFSKLYIANSIFRNNLAIEGGVISCFIDSSPVIINNLFYNNYALKNASILYSLYSYPELSNNTITGNFVLNEDLFFDTFTIHSFNSKPKYTNNIIVNNEVNTSEISSNKLFYTNYNNIENTEFDLVNGNLDLDPLFDSGNVLYPYSLLLNSPCINFGTNGDEVSEKYFIHFTETDLAGQDRIVNENIDMGAFENTEVGIDDNYELAITNYELKQNYPNPFNPITKISYELSVNSDQLVEIVVYNVIGQKVWSSPLTAHRSRVTDFVLFNGSKFNSGIYYYSLIVEGKKIDTKKMILIK